MDHPPAYSEFSNQEKPPVHWVLPNGEWVGIWGEEWGDLMGAEIMKADPEIEFEVWQPDLRADKVYSHTFDGGLKHLHFPAQEKYFWYGLKRHNYISSNQLINLIKSNLSEITILHLPFPHFPLVKSVINHFKNEKIVVTCLGDLHLPLNRLGKFSLNVLSKFYLFREHFILKKILAHVNSFTLINHKFLKDFSKVYPGPYSIVPMGIDTEYWTKKDKAACRKALNLPKDRIILFSSSRLIQLKQVDKLISILNRISLTHDFVYVVSGHGTREYEQYLRTLAQPLIEKKQILFTGYVSNEELLDYYNAADLFILTSLTEGSPVGVQKAFACGVPVISTNVGYTAELMQEHNVGIVLEKSDYEQWEKQLSLSFSGKFPLPFDRTMAEKEFSWPNVANKFIQVFKNCQGEQP